MKSGASSDLLTIEPTAKSARATLYPSSTTQELSVADAVAYNTNHRALVTAGINDDNLRFNRSDRMGSQCIGTVTLLFNEPFFSTTLLLNKWAQINTTMAATQSTAGFLFNSGAITTLNTGYVLYTHKNFQVFARAPIQAKVRARLNHVTNSVMEFGFGAPATYNGATPVGAYFQVTSGGVLQPVLTYNGSNITGSAITFSTSNYYTFDIIADDDEVHFFVQDTSTGQIINEQAIKVPLTQARKWNAGSLPFYSRQYHTGVAPASAPQLIMSECTIGVLDTNLNMPLSYLTTMMGDGVIHNPTTGAQNTTFANSAAPANATLSNTAAGYATAGGLFSFAAVAGAATDYALFAWQVPVGKQLVITGVDINAWNTGAAVATTPTLLVWGLQVNSTAVSLATASYIRQALGAMSFPIGAVIGATADRTISVDFGDSPVVCESGRFCAVTLRMPVGTATASQVVQGTVTVKGFYA